MTGARYCSSCGAALGDDTLLMSASSTSVVDEAGSNGVDRRWLAVVTAAVAGLIGWSVWSSSQASTDPASGGDSPVATTVPTTVPTIVDEGQPETVPVDVFVRQIGSGAPLLGEVTGLRAVFVQRPSQLSVLDLDNGKLLSIPTIYSLIEPMMVSGDWLVASVDGSLSSLAMSDLGNAPIALLPDIKTEPFGRSIIFPEPRSDGAVWIVLYRDGAPVFTLVDLASGAALQEFVPPDGVFTGNWIRHDLDDDQVVFSSADGGVYVSEGSGYRRVAEGRLIATDDQRALIESCDELLRCQIRWLDRSTWLPIDLALPVFDFYGAEFVGGTDWLLLVNWGAANDDQWLFNVTTGRRRQLDVSDHLAFEASSPPISPDGRWMALHDGANLVIVDLMNDVRHTIEGVEGLSGGMVLTAADVSIGSGG